MRKFSTDKNYRSGDLSLFPLIRDSRFSLYEASNNAETILKQTLTANSRYIVVESTLLFPNSGLLKISSPDGTGNSEIIFYERKIANQFHILHRAAKRSWTVGSAVTSPVMAEHHMALKDAIIKIQRAIGLKNTDDPTTLTGQIKTLENRWLAPKVIFRTYPRSGPAPLTVRLQNFSSGDGVRFLWDFGDGNTSIEKHPTHTYFKEGKYNIKLNVVSASGIYGSAEKSAYVEVNNSLITPFFYCKSLNGYSLETKKPTTFEFIDQSPGDIVERHWLFDDGEDLVTIEHVVNHVFQKPGEYEPSLIIKLKDGTLLRASLGDKILVL